MAPECSAFIVAAAMINKSDSCGPLADPFLDGVVHVDGACNATVSNLPVLTHIVFISSRIKIPTYVGVRLRVGDRGSEW